MSRWPPNRWEEDELVSKTRARVDQGALNLTPSQAETSYQGSMAGTNRHDDDAASSRVSMYSYRSNDRDNMRFVKEVDGRTINALSDQYYLPTDDPEWERLDKQHVAVVLGLGGLYPAKEVVRAVLAQQEGVQKSILDLGCGTGVWAVEMAKEFPWADVVGVDLALCPLEPENVPPNCRFEMDNLNLGLSHYENQFDVVHLRFVGSGLKDFPQRMKDVHATLKPGGVVLWVDVDYSLYFTPEFRYIPFALDANDPVGAWGQRSLAEMRRACTIVGSDIHGMEDALDNGLWNNEQIDPETCKTGSLYLPIGPWATHEDPAITQKLRYIGALMRTDAINGMKSIRPLLSKFWPPEIVDQWAKMAQKENMEMKNSPSMRVRLAWGRKRADGEERAPPLPLRPEPTESSSDDDALSDTDTKPYPFLFIYDSPEVSMEQKLLRNRDKVVSLPPSPSKS
ncbi:hypothetical protein M408DRAFT_331978 [Serendipita vermifera MAFF 305830]|uniref:Methyltransferase domain-containing protein n=1 Tax=Serendipita vermifera MAFF 305830 TaxID=933852 RepID=A0A0C3AVN3_SERVB|nr:hypothetical protein M408DRAFT_331978 [Serendipita vermifera MAFF 305830]